MQRNYNYLVEGPLNPEIYVSSGVRITNVAINLSSPSPALSAAQKIDSFAHLPQGWHYGRGGPIDNAIRSQASAWNQFLMEIGVVAYTDAFPGENFITLGAGLLRSHYLEVTIKEHDNGFEYSVIHSYNRQKQFYRTSLSLKVAVELVSNVIDEVTKEVLEASWKSSASFTHRAITSAKGNSPQQHMKTGAGGYLSSITDVLLHQTQQSVPTFTNISIGHIPTITRLYFGGSIPTTSQTIKG
jgi:hypothetical protein